MRVAIMTVILGLPLMALGQQTDPQQTQGQTKRNRRLLLQRKGRNG